MAKKRKAAPAPQTGVSQPASQPAPAAAPPAAAAPAAAAATAAPRPAHRHTDVAPTGLGAQLAATPGRLARGPLRELVSSFPAAKWAPPAAARSACPASPAAAVELELARAAALEQLRQRLASLCAKAGLRNVPLLAFERWRFAAKWAEDEPELAAQAAAPAYGGAGPAAAAADAAAAPGKRPGKPAGSGDPVVPFGCLQPAPEPGLVSDLVRAGLAAAAAEGVAAALGGAAAEACGRLATRRHQLASGKPPRCPEVQLAFHRHSLDLTCGGRFVRVSREYYGKLARLYRAHWLGAAATGSIGQPLDAAAARLAELEAAGGGGGGEPVDGGDGGAAAAALGAEARIAEVEAAAAAAGSGAGGAGGRAELHQRLFALLLRYKSLQGAGFQAAAGPPVFQLLRERLAVGFECFASPLNAAFARFGSAFPDVDAPFGSAGSFFRLPLKHGSYEVNPPFVPAILTAAALRMLALLQAAEAAGGALSFAVLLPGWEEVPGWSLLHASPFLRSSLLVAAADHGYCDGASHQARDSYRQSPYDSGLLVLQTSAAAARWRVGDPLQQQLRAALAACCPSAAAAERQRKQRGQGDLEWRGLGAAVQKAPPAGAAPAAAGSKRPAAAGGEAGEQRLPKGKKRKHKHKEGQQQEGQQHTPAQQQQQQQQRQQQQQQQGQQQLLQPHKLKHKKHKRGKLQHKRGGGG